MTQWWDNIERREVTVEGEFSGEQLTKLLDLISKWKNDEGLIGRKITTIHNKS